MTKTDQNRALAWRLKILRQAREMPRNVAQTCRHFGISRKRFTSGARDTGHGEAGLGDRPRAPHRSPDRRRVRSSARSCISASTITSAPARSPTICSGFTSCRWQGPRCIAFWADTG